MIYNRKDPGSRFHKLFNANSYMEININTYRSLKLHVKDNHFNKGVNLFTNHTHLNLTSLQTYSVFTLYCFQWKWVIHIINILLTKSSASMTDAIFFSKSWTFDTSARASSCFSFSLITVSSILDEAFFPIGGEVCKSLQLKKTNRI